MTAMTISDTERREVAARLRKAIGLTEFAEVLGFNWDDDSDWVWNDVSSLVADLIEPSIPSDPGEAGLACVDAFIREMRHSTKEEQDEYGAKLEKMSVELHPVDRDALLALADEIKSDTSRVDELQLGIYGSCYLSGIARCIRDALGVES